MAKVKSNFEALQQKIKYGDSLNSNDQSLEGEGPPVGKVYRGGKTVLPSFGGACIDPDAFMFGIFGALLQLLLFNTL